MAMYKCIGCGVWLDDDYHPMNEEEQCPSCHESAQSDPLAGMHEICEIWAGSEGFIPQTAPEAYQQRLIRQMVDVAVRFIKRGG